MLIAAFGSFVNHPARAIPLFARKYNTTCFTCHTSPPLLNDFGRRFQANGYQIPGSGNDLHAQHDQNGLPLALLSQPMIAHTSISKNGMTSSSTYFSGVEVGIFSSSSLGSHISYFTDIPIALDGREVTIGVNDIHIIYSNVLNNSLGELNFRFGKMRLFLPFNANTMLSNADPLPYTYSPFSKSVSDTNSHILSEPMFAFSAFGMLPELAEGLRWEVALTSGSRPNVDLGVSRALYISLNQTWYAADAPIRLGAIVYNGVQGAKDTLTKTIWTNYLNRVGIDFEVYDPWTKRFDLFGQYLIGTDSRVDKSGTSKKMSGGLLGINVILIPEQWYAFGRFDYLETKNIPSISRQFDIGLRCHALENAIVTIGVSSLIEQANALDRTTMTLSGGILFGF